MPSQTNQIRTGILENWKQFSLLVLINAFVGAMVGMERAILPAIAEQEFRMVVHTAILAFIVVFGVSKALTNYFAGRFSDVYGRKIILVIGWLIATPVPFMLMWAPSWNWVLLSNLFLGVSQGLTWSTTVIMKVDLAGPKCRGLAMGINEFVGYLAVGITAFSTGWIAANYGLKPEPFYLGIIFIFAGLILSITCVHETQHHAKHETSLHPLHHHSIIPSQRTIFWNTTLYDRNLSSVSQVGFVNNMNDGVAWGLFPLAFAASGLGLIQIGWLAAIYPVVWGVCQLFTGALSDQVGRKWLIVIGMWVQALGIFLIASSIVFTAYLIGAVLLGIGTAMVYPTLLATIADIVNPAWRASAIGVYRLWRDLGYAAGALISGIVSDLFGLTSALWLIATITLLSGTIAAFRMEETLRFDQKYIPK